MPENEKLADIHLAKDPVLAPLVHQLTLTPLVARRQPFAHLVCSILSQQLSTHVADRIIQRFEACCQDDIRADTILSLSAETLRGVGLSRQKQSYIRNIAAHYMREPIFWEKLSDKEDSELLEELTTIKGVGVWTTQMLLMFNLHRPDILPLGDLAVREAMCKRYAVTGKGKSLHQKLERIGECWSPYRSRASRYLWKWRDLSTQKT